MLSDAPSAAFQNVGGVLLAKVETLIQVHLKLSHLEFQL